MKTFSLKFILLRIGIVICLLQLMSVQSFGQKMFSDSKDIPLILQKQITSKTFVPEYTGKLSKNYKDTDWSALIDSTWGSGLPTVEKLEIFDTFWNTIDREFPCFQDLDVNWDSLKIVYRPEVEGGISRGRFAAIMNHLGLSLKESHTYIDDIIVNRNTTPAPGVPLLSVGGWGETGCFGAGLTPLQDNSLLVYNTVTSHPLGLEPGDIVLGYEGIPWKDLYPELLNAQLPIYGWGGGCSESASHHTWLISAGMNWHLFNTIDIIKYASGDTLHLSTDALIDQNMNLTSLEQLEISPRIPILDIQDIIDGNVVSSGIVPGTQIGYIYIWGWWGNAEEAFFSAVNLFMNSMETTGLIIDFRYNWGGNMLLSNKALELLFDSSVETIAFANRSDPLDHFAMEPASNSDPSTFEINGQPGSYYDKPIAVLTGPGCVSSGDQVALRMKFHPEVRIFGKPTNAAFNSPILFDLGNEEWKAVSAAYDAYLVTDPDHYLTHDEFVVDEEVWLTQEDVVNGTDTVVEAAIAWITETSISDPSNHFPETLTLCQNYPNPFNPTTTIHFTLPSESTVELHIFDIRGREVVRKVEEKMEPGEHRIKFNATGLSCGIYFYRIKSDGFMKTKKMVLTK